MLPHLKANGGGAAASRHGRNDPCDDTDRLQALQRYGILDTPMEPAYDELADLAGYICEAPVALISLLDNQRQWFKAARGFALRETPLNESVCRYAIRQSGVFIVPDLAQDPRFAHYAIVTQKNPLRFYAGAPLVTPDGFVLGTLCVLDHRPRELSAKVQDLLSALARQVIRLLELKRANDRQGQMLVELESARHQMDVLAHTDVLTGLANRRSFTDRLRQEWALLQRVHEPACLLMMDLDHFKRVNDVYGHHVGDQALQLFATLCRDVSRAADVLGRWGARSFWPCCPPQGSTRHRWWPSVCMRRWPPTRCPASSRRWCCRSAWGSRCSTRCGRWTSPCACSTLRSTPPNARGAAAPWWCKCSAFDSCWRILH